MSDSDISPSNDPPTAATFHAAQKLKAKIVRIAAHQFGCAETEVAYQEGVVSNTSGKRLSWVEHVNIAHRNFHLLPDGLEPGLEATHVMQVPTGTKLPEDGRVQMYPCHSFEFHLVLIAFDPEIGKPEIRRYVIGHDCGTVINPHIVKGMTLGGIAHGIGAALLEEFVYDSEGQMLTQSFMDYLLPSSHEVPRVEIVHHCTPSPLTVFGQKGSGESGYLGSPAAISGAINDAVASLGISFSRLPIRIAAISDANLGRDFVPEHVEPTSHDLALDPVRVQPLKASCYVSEGFGYWARRLVAGEREAEAAALFDELYRGKVSARRADGIEQRGRHQVGVTVYDHFSTFAIGALAAPASPSTVKRHMGGDREFDLASEVRLFKS